MKRINRSAATIVAAFSLIFSLNASAHKHEYDVVIVGGTPAGITAAIAAAREGKECVILERTQHVGGLPVNGLGATDIATRGATAGLFNRFVETNRQYYIDRFGEGSEQVEVCSNGYHFEPSVAAVTFDKMLSDSYPGSITVLTMKQFDSEPENVRMVDGRISMITILDRKSGESEQFYGKMFIDATYEGDLGAAAGVPYRLGREGADEYGEPCAGKIYKWWGGPSGEGSTGKADNAVQAYNYRLCLTDDPANMIPVTKPADYDRSEYESLVDDVWDGRHTGYRFSKVTQEQMSANRKSLAEGGRTTIPGDPWGIWKITNIVHLPNRKTDANNQHLALISTDLPEENWPWPTAGWDWRDRYAERLKNYTLGLLWFVQNDGSLPESFRNECRKWGFAADEYQDNGGFPRQVYVREGRRLEGMDFFTAHDAMPVENGERPPVYATSITASHYALDSHAVLKRESGRIHLDGFFSHASSVYTVPYGVMVPEDIQNLLFPVAVSGSHVGFSTLRMEPCWMAMGEAAGTAAAISIDSSSDVRSIDIGILQDKLLDHGAVLIYFNDVKTSDPAFSNLQKAALKGCFPTYEADLDAGLDKKTAKEWSKLCGRKIRWTEGMTRRDGLQQLF